MSEKKEYISNEVAVIILAAGGSQRMGDCKQTLDWKGKPMVRHVAEIALDSQVGPVMVVTGAFKEEVEQSIIKMRIAIVHNRYWQNGQGTSIKSAMTNMPGEMHGCIFLMADQPFVTEADLRCLVHRSRNSNADIIVPTINSKRVSPVMFKQSTFQRLSLIGDRQTGRDVFSEYDLDEFEVENKHLGVDIDTPEAYERWNCV